MAELAKLKVGSVAAGITPFLVSVHPSKCLDCLINFLVVYKAPTLSHTISESLQQQLEIN
jgi:hypothetical protein